MCEKSFLNLLSIFQKHCCIAQDFISAAIANHSFLIREQFFLNRNKIFKIKFYFSK